MNENINDEMLAEDAATPTVGHNSLAQLSDIVLEHQNNLKEISDLEARVKERKAENLKIEMETLPDMMLQIGMKTFSTSEGFDVEVTPVITGSIPKKNTEKAHKWLRENDHADIIKNVLTISFTKGQDEEAIKVSDSLEEQGYAPTTKESVHTSTLKSWAKEQIESGKVIPLKLLGIFHARKALITVPKKK